MDIQGTAREIGLFETAINISKVKNSIDVINKIGMSFPLPDDAIKDRTKKVAEWLLGFGKSRYMFFMPELALIEEMKKRMDNHFEVIIVIPSDLDMDAKERINRNLPKEVKTIILPEPFFIDSFFPRNGMIVASGYFGCERAMVLPDTYRMIEHYRCFHGKKVFVPYVELAEAYHYEQWKEINQSRLSAIWRSM